jgi:chromosome segregation ATPase
MQNPKLLRIKEVLIRKNREHAKVEDELKHVSAARAHYVSDLDQTRQRAETLDQELKVVESQSQSGEPKHNPYYLPDCQVRYRLSVAGCSRWH